MTGVIAPLGVRHGWLVCSAVFFASWRLGVRHGPVGMFRGLLCVLASLRETRAGWYVPRSLV